MIFGNGFDFWIHKLLLLDSISYLSHGKLSLPLVRYLLIDVDDIFVGEQGTRMKPIDVEALISAQDRFKRLVPGFRFNLGFSGKFYHKGSPEEDEGDDMLIGKAWLRNGVLVSLILFIDRLQNTAISSCGSVICGHTHSLIFIT